MRNRNRKDTEEWETPIAYREKLRAKAYARMGRNDVVETPRRSVDHYPVAPNGRPYDPRSGRYVDR